jgi:hypothetical protein
MAKRGYIDLLVKLVLFTWRTLALDAHECEEMVEMTVRLCQEDLLVVISTVVAARSLRNKIFPNIPCGLVE